MPSRRARALAAVVGGVVLEPRNRFAETGADHEQPGEREAQPTGPEKARMRATMIAGRDRTCRRRCRRGHRRVCPSAGPHPADQLAEPALDLGLLGLLAQSLGLAVVAGSAGAGLRAASLTHAIGSGRWCRRPRTFRQDPSRVRQRAPGRHAAGAACSSAAALAEACCGWLGEGLRMIPQRSGTGVGRGGVGGADLSADTLDRGAVRIGKLPGGVDDAVGGVGDRADDLVTAGAQAVRRRSGRPDRRNGPDQRSRCRADGPARRGRC